MKATRTKTKGNRWCRLEVEHTDGRLSICGSEGRIVAPKAAKSEALAYWTSFFDEDRAQLHEMNDRLGRHFRTSKAAAKFVIDTDGDYHGLDVDGNAPDGRLLITESCGQIREALARWFPEVVPYLAYHLNDMHSECIHQEARGETWTTHPGAECPDCGYKLGSAWTRRELPADVLAWIDSLKTTEAA